MSETLSQELEEKLSKFVRALVDQDRARVLVRPLAAAEGYWFGGGDLVSCKGERLLVGRYRNAGDSRTGVEAGERGLRLSVFRVSGRADDLSAEEIRRFSKPDLAPPGHEVLSIEGAALLCQEDAFTLYVSTEKKSLSYPPAFSEFQKPGTGVWSVEVTSSATIDRLGENGFRTAFSSVDPVRLHMKDPYAFLDASGKRHVVVCTHPFSWSSSNSSIAQISRSGEVGPLHHEFLPRGNTWDVAMTRVTGSLLVPRMGAFRNGPRVRLFFYDGGESVRKYEEHRQAKSRPRGYSCEEISGVAYCLGEDFSRPVRLSRYLPFFMSPKGTGSSRYTKALVEDGGITAIWEQSQDDLSQPLVYHNLPMEQAEEILS